MRVMGIAGSLREGSLNRALLAAAVELAPGGMTIVPYEGLADIPMYNGDIDTDELRPASVVDLKRRIAEADALLILSPEYNYSIPGVLKNAIDWASRPGYKSVLGGKPAAIGGASGGGIGTARMQVHLREVLYATLVRVMPHPGLLVGVAQTKFADGKLTDESTRQFLTTFLADFQKYAAGQQG
ncbi:NADPH-dependent FMN reductase [Longimicrobium terrae]|uniref:Chromate reductase n=2 Tax=Longimicrobium terrae TaxID=1639882 RepID=A0A841H061_9BACT|nr:NADPH-dependent FMN reductase [Longimicrobium terrae]MBB6071451.1 chromate reductase [Longimicrobium terrae]NNC31331.1 NAD(P)H-dependent oxidoreductase [Longimicrobium terrae]